MASKEHKISNHTVAGTTWDMIWTILDTLEIVRKPGSATSHSIIVHAGDKVVIMFLLKLCHLFDLLYLNSLVYIFMRIFMFLSCYYYWIFGSPHPTVCKLVFFHLHLASGLNLWKFPLAIMHLHFFVWRHPKTCTRYLIPSLPSFSQLNLRFSSRGFFISKTKRRFASPQAPQTMYSHQLGRTRCITHSHNSLCLLVSHRHK